MCVLLPKTGVNPLKMMEQFKAGETSVMIATPNSVRGLDFPDLSHVYTLYLPIDDPREYVHLAGRVGRVGQNGSVRGGGGRVISILSEKDAAKMEELAKELKFDFVDVEPPAKIVATTDDASVELENAGLDEMKRRLEDTITLLNLAEDPEVDLDRADADENDNDAAI